MKLNLEFNYSIYKTLTRDKLKKLAIELQLQVK